MKIVALILAGIIGLSGCGVGESPTQPNPTEPSVSSEKEYQYNWDVNPNSEFNGYIPSDELKFMVDDAMFHWFDTADKSEVKFALIDLDKSNMGLDVEYFHCGEGPEIALYFPDLEKIYIMTIDDSTVAAVEGVQDIPNAFWPIENVTDPEIAMDYENSLGLRINDDDYYHFISSFCRYCDETPMDGTDQYSVVEWNNLYV